MTWFLSYVTNQGQINIHLFLSSFFFPADIWKLTLDECLTFTTFNICILHTIISKAKPTFHRFVCLLKGQFDNGLIERIIREIKIVIYYIQSVWKSDRTTMFENHRKSLIQYCERSELCLHFEWRKVNSKNAKNAQFGEFLKMKLAVKQCYQIGDFQ